MSNFLDNLTIANQILAESASSGTANDFWVVVDCKKSIDFKDYLHRTNAQGLINIVTKLNKSKNTRNYLDTIAIFNKDDKSQAEKEAKRRAKLMKKTDTDSKKEQVVDDEKLSENYYSPVNAQGVTPSGSSEVKSPSDIEVPTVYGMKNDHNRIYQKSEQDATDNEDRREVKVPKEVLRLLQDGASEARRTAENLIITKSEDKRFYGDLAQAFDDLHGMLSAGTIDGVKQAQIFLTSLMGPMLYRVPSEVATFIAQGGEPRTLRSYVNSITVPKMGYGADGELDKL